MINLHKSMGPGPDRTRDQFLLSVCHCVTNDIFNQPLIFTQHLEALILSIFLSVDFAWYLHALCQATKAQTSLCKCTDLSETSLLWMQINMAENHMTSKQRIPLKKPRRSRYDFVIPKFILICHTRVRSHVTLYFY